MATLPRLQMLSTKAPSNISPSRVVWPIWRKPSIELWAPRDRFESILEIRGEKREEKEEKGKVFHCIERHHGSFSRSITLPAEIQPDKVEAQFREGVLRVTMPKSEAAASRKIAVKS
jgi:HSP20 family molecular chaperone IbpA